MNIINCKGMNCPLPVINTKKYFDGIEEGEAIVLVDNEVAKDNIYKFATGYGYNVVVVNDAEEYKITINKTNSIKKVENNNDFILVISTDKLGQGDDNLGEMLMKAYVYTLSENENRPKEIMLLNGGVKLAIENSNSLESLKKLSELGVEILSCGACLDFYGVKDKLSVGTITNMYVIVEKMNTSRKVIKI